MNERERINNLAQIIAELIENEAPACETDDDETVEFYDCVHRMQEALENIGFAV